jgi:hypothetical protein
MHPISNACPSEVGCGVRIAMTEARLGERPFTRGGVDATSSALGSNRRRTAWSRLRPPSLAVRCLSRTGGSAKLPSH